ncbi:hypothetical protein [Parasitella parasitica]|uniref:F-BAR domain-containing protein n=1 Tax=Parasitella parasitica TaxID=35722 RepID=A0A0B7N3A7_9FUNG|nr:hypothetical protein [Parasitella parasitica]
MLLESTADTNIENNFWSPDKLGLNILLGKLEASNKSILAIQNYFAKRYAQKRAQIEEEYGNQLLQLSESLHQIEECFGSIVTTSEMTARAHIDLGQNIRNMLELPLDTYLKDQESMSNQMRELQNTRIGQLERIEKARQCYMDECQNSNASLESINIFDGAYQKSIKEMQTKYAQWVHDWRDSCKMFQSVELHRMDYIKAVIKTFATMVACAFSIDDQSCERMLMTMEDLDINRELINFVKGHRTGSLIPAIPTYTQFTQPLDTKRKATVIPPVATEKRTIREINIPIKHDEELRSVNDQLRKKIPTNPWSDPKSNGNAQPHPLNPVYRSSQPSQSDPVLNNWYNNFQSSPTSPTSPTPENKSTLVTPHEKATYVQHINNTNTPIKKPSILLSSIGFFKKKKGTQGSSRELKRLSLGPTVVDPLLPTQESILEQPPSPIFSPIDFYYSPADIDRNMKKTTVSISPSSSQIHDAS